ncbi:MAG: tetratricopeptide repeat protein [Candidatus Sungbacteria bacterium]|nr:tetratricopeptide repeat protein [Candidatus Sungbacteria bacterium]
MEILKELLKKKELAIFLLMVSLLVIAFIFSDRIQQLLGLKPVPSSQTEEAIPSYTGRPLDEYRETPEEVKLFTEEQKGILRGQIQSLAAAIRANPDSLDPWLRLGITKKVIGDFEGARDAWEYASFIRPQNVISFRNLGEIYWHYLPDYPRAEANLRKAIENDSSYVDVYITLSELYRYSYTEKADLADDVLLEGFSKNPEKAHDFLAYLGRYYKETGNTAKAIEYFEKLLLVDPGNADTKDELRKLRSR